MSGSSSGGGGVTSPPEPADAPSSAAPVTTPPAPTSFATACAASPSAAPRSDPAPDCPLSIAGTEAGSTAPAGPRGPSSPEDIRLWSEPSSLIDGGSQVMQPNQSQKTSPPFLFPAAAAPGSAPWRQPRPTRRCCRPVTPSPVQPSNPQRPSNSKMPKTRSLTRRSVCGPPTHRLRSSSALSSAVFCGGH